MQKWEAQRHSQGKKYYGGHFSSELEAAKKSDELARKHLGFVPSLNFPTKSEKKKLGKNKVTFQSNYMYVYFLSTGTNILEKTCIYSTLFVSNCSF